MIARVARGTRPRFPISTGTDKPGVTTKPVEPHGEHSPITWGDPPARVKMPSLRIAEATEQTVRLSGREAQILALISQGHTNKSASDALFVSRRTVEFHLANAYKKLGACNRIQAILAASRLGLIPAEPAFEASWGPNKGLLRELVSDCPEQRVVRREAVGNFAMQQSSGGTS